MKHLSAFALPSLLNGAHTGSNDPASSCVLAQVLPSVTVGCSEALASATQQSGHQSYSPSIVEPGVDHPGTQSLTAVPSQSTSSSSGEGSGETSDSRPVINGHSG
ncbi:hypothetical protein DER46DRAFT_666745 [Fusarium sp. MPI-SDFR-AT-0072]|nr:hypothetical protein DER46DRAFT_666745 [Fusarium sp. MPI-SDFR-AT-0072]